MADRAAIHQAITRVYGEKPHPDVPEIKVKEYEAFARAAAMMHETSEPSPQQVQTAYHALKGSGIAPAEFERLWVVAKPLANRLLHQDPTIHDLTMLVGSHPHEVQSYYMDHPHPQAPEASAGDIARYAAVSLYPARRLAGREPNLVELHKFVMGNYSMQDIVSHFAGDHSGNQGEADSGTGGGGGG